MLSLSLLFLALGVSADTCQNIAGNYYCDETRLVQFENVGFNGQYNRVTSFNADGTCSSTPQSFSGNLSPFDEELSVHFRGPIQLENFQVYRKSGSSNQKKRHLHHRHAEPEPVYVTAYEYYTDYVTVTGNGEASPSPSPSSSSSSAAPAPVEVTTSPVAASSAAAAPVEVTTSPVSSSSAAPAVSSTESAVSPHQGKPQNYNFNHLDQTSATGPSVITVSPTWPASTSTYVAPAPTSSSGNNNGGNSGWTQIANYNAQAASADGLTFLNNLGGSGSGVFDFKWGNSLSYAGADGVSCAASPQVLSQTTVPSNKEFIIFSDNECQGNDCGYYRPGTVAYHGFGGNEKVFVFEFSMPSEGADGFNGDMPAVWLLNAQIPRTLQYGEISCSCWSSGCGELDLWEILNGGNDRMIATLHDNQNGGGGSANYFNRPTSGTFKGACVFDGTTISVIEIDEIPSSIDDSTIQSWISQAGYSSQVSL